MIPDKKVKLVSLRGWDITRGKKTVVLPHESVKMYHDAIWKQANDFFTQNILPDWEANDRLYQDRYELPFRRYNWQSQMKDPVVDNLVTRISYFMHRSLVNIAVSGNYFTVGHIKENRTKAYEELLQLNLRHNEYPRTFTKSFARSLVNAIMAHKVMYVNDIESYPEWDATLEKYTSLKEVVRGRVKCLMVDPKDMRLDPSGADRYIMEQVRNVPYHEFLRVATANKWINLKAVDELVRGDSTANHLPTVNLKYVYTKTLTDSNGREVTTNIYYVIVNDQYVVHLDNNLLPNGMFPYSVSNPMMDIYGRYGRAYVSKIADIVTHYVGFLNLTLDGAMLAALGLHEYDISVASADSAHSFTAGVIPGMMYPKDGPGSVLNSMFPTNNSTPGLLSIGYFLDRELQNKGYVNEFFQGSATAKGRPTLGEVNLKTQESTAFFTDMATHVEADKISKDLELILYTQLMNIKSHAEDLEEILSDASQPTKDTLNALTPEEIESDLINLRIEVTGVSGKIKRMANFNRYLQIWQVIGNIPGVQSTTLFTHLIRKLFEIMDDSPEEVLDMDSLEQIQEAMTQMQLQQLQQATAQAGQPPEQQPADGAPPPQNDPRGEPSGAV